MVVLSFFGISAEGRIIANLASESPLYNYLDRLEAYGCAKPTLRFMKPQAYGDV